MVFVLDRHQKPLMPCSEKRARLLLERGRARVHKMAPFTIRVVDRHQEDSALQDLRVKLDPGSKTTGMAMILDGQRGAKGVFLGEIAHKSLIIARLDARRTVRRSRRFRHTRYLAARFLHRRRKTGWLPPSLQARVDQPVHAVAKIRSLAPITALSVEHVRFDTQKMQDPEIRGVEYQQGTLLGYEVREYLLEKFPHHCAYCGGATGDPELHGEHVVPKTLTTAHAAPIRSRTWPSPARPAMRPRAINNRRTGWRVFNGRDARWIRFGPRGSPKRWPNRQNRCATPRCSTRPAGGYTTNSAQPVFPSKAGRAAGPKCNGLNTTCPKSTIMMPSASARARLRPSRRFRFMWQSGWLKAVALVNGAAPTRHLSGPKQHVGFQTGDRVKAVILRGKYTGTWVGRATAKASGQILITTEARGIHLTTSYPHCRVLQRGDGWMYTQKLTNSERIKAASASA